MIWPAYLGVDGVPKINDELRPKIGRSSRGVPAGVPGSGVEGPAGVNDAISSSRGVLSRGVLGSLGVPPRGVFGASARGDAAGDAAGEAAGVASGVLEADFFSFLLPRKGRFNGPVPFAGRRAGKFSGDGDGASFPGGGGG